MIVPKYMLTFRCIGGACEDNCCIGWDVDIDKKTYLKYQKIQEPRMKREFNKYIHLNPYCYDPLVDYAYAALDDSKRCQFLNAENLCIIHKYLGESYLSNVCTNFPRIINKIDDLMEQSATPSCPEISRKLVLEPDAMNFICTDDNNANELLTYKIKQNDKRFKDTLISQLKTIRDYSLAIISNKNFSIEENLSVLSYFIEDCFQLERNHNINMIKQIIEKYEIYQNSKASLVEFFESKKMLTKSQNDFIYYTDYLLMHLKNIGASDSDRFTHFSAEALKGNFEIGCIKYNEMTLQSAHILKNYFANHIFRTLFPFSEGENIREALWLALIRFGIIKRQLIGLMGRGEQLTEQSISNYLQVVSKVIEHHKHFEISTLEQLRKQKGQTNELVNTLLQFMGI
ncbi:flagellin lysine-N-methylase [Fusibacter bizertensis]